MVVLSRVACRVGEGVVAYWRVGAWDHRATIVAVARWREPNLRTVLPGDDTKASAMRAAGWQPQACGHGRLRAVVRDVHRRNNP